MLAARWGSTACAELLIARGADPLALNEQQQTAAEIARDSGFLALADALSPPASTSAPPEDPFSPPEISIDLTDWNVELSATDTEEWQPEGSTPLPVHDSSCIKRAEETQRRLTEHGARDDWEVWSAEGITLPEIRKVASLDDLEDGSAAQIIRALLTIALQAGHVSPTWITEQLVTLAALKIHALEPTLCQILADLGVLIDHDAPELPQRLAEDAVWSQPLHQQINCTDVEALILDVGWRRWDPDRLYQLALDDKLLSHEEEMLHGRTLRESLEQFSLLLQGHPDGQRFLAMETQGQCLDSSDPDSDLTSGILPDPELPDTLSPADEDAFGSLATQPATTSLILPQAARILESLSKTGLPHLLHAQLEQHLRTASRARGILISKNLRLVFEFANKYRFGDVPFSDLIQEGNIGLIKAVDKYDPELGFRFSTYACWWIRQAISRSFADTCRLIRVPAHMHHRLAHLEKALHDQEPPAASSADIEMLATELGWTRDAVISAIQVWDRIQIEECEIDTLSTQNLSFSVDINDPETVMAREILNRSIATLLGRIKPAKAANIIRMRFGIGLDREYTLEEIGQALDVSRERIRQIEAKAFRHIRKIAAEMFAAEAPAQKKAEKEPVPDIDMPEILADIVIGDSLG